ncbi:MAG: HXXEE domain-containing protein [Bacteroidota bacterium]
MKSSVSTTFLILVILQALHSFEEYLGELWANFPPATFLCGLISSDLEFGFLLINIGLFMAGLIVWWFPVRSGDSFGRFFIWFWIVIELLNGVIHPAWSIYQKAYTPGVITAPLLLLTALVLIKHVQTEKQNNLQA